MVGGWIRGDGSLESPPPQQLDSISPFQSVNRGQIICHDVMSQDDFLTTSGAEISKTCKICYHVQNNLKTSKVIYLWLSLSRCILRHRYSPCTLFKIHSVSHCFISSLPSFFLPSLLPFFSSFFNIHWPLFSTISENLQWSPMHPDFAEFKISFENVTFPITRSTVI